jgi:hypothetical protein
MTPANKVTVELLGERVLVFLNSNGGGIGGNRERLVGTIVLPEHLRTNKDVVRTAMDQRSVQLELPESRRTLYMRPKWISSIEPVNLWRYTLVHSNSNFPTPYTALFTAPRHLVYVADLHRTNDMERLVAQRGTFIDSEHC